MLTRIGKITIPMGATYFVDKNGKWFVTENDDRIIPPVTKKIASEDITYFYNDKNEKTTYDETDGTCEYTKEVKNQQDSKWQKIYDENYGRYYYYNKETDVSTWELPDNSSDNEAEEAARKAAEEAARKEAEEAARAKKRS